MAIRITGMNSGLDTESIITELVSAYKEKGDKYTKAQTKLSWTQDAWKSLNTKIFSFYKSLDNLRLGTSLKSKKSTVSDSSKATVTASNDAVNGTQKLEISKLANSGYLTGDEIKTWSGTVNGQTTISQIQGYTAGAGDGIMKLRTKEGKSLDIKVSGSTKIEDIVKQINESDLGINASFDSENKRFFISTKSTGEKSDFDLTADANDAVGTAALDALGLTYDPNDIDNANNKGKKINGSDAEIILNNVKYKSSNNSFSVNGLSIKAQSVTTGAISITTDVDTQGMYDKIKDFLSSYNDLIKEMSTLYNADSSKGYEPLTKDEKEEMSESEVEEWEKKIKGSLLRRDSTLNSVMNAMTSVMSSAFTVNGKNYTLANFGIKTQGYFTSEKNERYVYHIDGDSEDDTTSAATDQLMSMLTSDPDAVSEFIKQLTSKLYDNLDEKMKSTTLSSIYTVYNDKEMAKSYSDYTTTIKAWEEKVQSIEDKYYKKFSEMEVALGKLQSQTSALTGMLG